MDEATCYRLCSHTKCECCIYVLGVRPIMLKGQEQLKRSMRHEYNGLLLKYALHGIDLLYSD